MIDFPASPAEGQVFQAPGGPQYVYSNGAWRMSGPTAVTGWEFIERVELSGAAVYTRNNLSTARRVRLAGTLHPSVNDNLVIHTSTNNGASFDAGATDYYNAGIRQNATTLVGVGSNFSAAFLSLTNMVTPTDGIDFEITFSEFNKAVKTWWLGHSAYVGAAGGVDHILTSGERQTLVARDALELRFFTAGTTMTGVVTLEIMRG